MEQKKRILAIVPQQEVYSKLEPMLGRSSFEVSRSANAASSLVLAANVTYDLIIAEYPLPDLSIVDFLDVLRGPGLPNTSSPIVLITAEHHLPGVQQFITGHESIEVVDREHASEELQAVLARGLAGVAARRAGRLMVQMEAQLGVGKLLRVCQTSNVSETGMLIRTSRLLPKETEVDISFYLPGDPRPIEGRVRVARHSNYGKERLTGMGVEFTHLTDASRDKLRDYVNGHWRGRDEDVLAVLPETGPGASRSHTY